MSTSGPNESELNRTFDTLRLFFATQTNESDAIIDTLGAIPVANVQHHNVALGVEEQPI